MIKRRFTFSENKISAVCRDSNYLWIAFLGSGGISTLYKVSAFDLSIIYFDINVTADEITKIKIEGSNVYLSLDNSTYIGMRLSSTNPLSTYNYFTKPGGITEKAVDVVIEDYAFFLIPAESSGLDAKLLRFSKTADSLDGTITLTGVRDASAVTSDNNKDLWVVSNASPISLIKIKDSTWTITSENIT